MPPKVKTCHHSHEVSKRDGRRGLSAQLCFWERVFYQETIRSKCMLKRVFFSHRVAGHKRTVPRSSRKEKRTQPKSRHIFTKTTTWYIRSHTSQTRMKTTTITTTTYVTPQRPSLMAWNGHKLFLLSFQLLTNNVKVNHSITKVVKGCTFRILDQIPTRVGNGKSPLEASTKEATT